MQIAGGWYQGRGQLFYYVRRKWLEATKKKKNMVKLNAYMKPGEIILANFVSATTESQCEVLSKP